MCSAVFSRFFPCFFLFPFYCVTLFFTVSRFKLCVDDQSARGVKYKLNFSGNLYRRTSHSWWVGKSLLFLLLLLVIILYAFLSQLRRSWFSSVCVSVCVCVSVRPRVRICGSAPWKRFVPSLSLSVSSNTSVSIFCVQRSAFSATTRCTVQSVSLTKHDQDNKKKS